ncbi:MAG TPA: histone deacetylase [Gemmatimonadaceae bacterium]|nr:histone deacetylase [Gemmatimonadaceae bacterium]
MPLHAWSSAAYSFPLPAGHRFPIEKYALLRDAVIAEGLVADVHEPARATAEELERVHTRDYVDRLTSGALSEAELRLLGFPWSRALVERSYRAVGGTLGAARRALEDGVAMNLAGGTHHAFPDRGEGFCVFNDVAIAVRTLRAEDRIRRVAIIDLDVHQGNGTHAIFAADRETYTFSMHGGRNYPFHKVPGTLDIELPDGTGDEDYLTLLSDALPRVLNEGRPDLVVYLAGADPHERDRLGRLKLTFEGLERRDAMVLEACRDVGIPVAITIAGGYGSDVRETVAIHVATARVARAFV